MKRLFLSLTFSALAISMFGFESIPLRILNHWDNLDGTIERGFAGKSIFFRNGTVKFDSLRIVEYGRINQSVGINGTVLNNVNASPKMMSHKILVGVKRIADILRPYGMKVYLSVNFATPMVLDSLKTADPLDKDVKAWWKKKADEIYSLIPDFGGFLVKANSEGQPGPMDFGRNHADGANMLAEALEPHGGIIMWRAFVYAANSNDRACQAYNEFISLDGKFKDNVILQIKNGPIDFQPREPISTLFFAMKKTKLMPEVQLTQEYLGESIHTVYLAPIWEEFLSTLNSQLSVPNSFPAVAGVSNIGDDANWCGNRFAVLNWIAFGKYFGGADKETIAQDFLSEHFSKDKKFVKTMTELLLRTREACVEYMMPMGLHHIFADGHHYGPAPWSFHKGLRLDWQPPYYHKADSLGIGFDRTSNGSNYVSQYPEPLASMYNNVKTCPDNLLLFFHHLPWTYKLHGKTLWENLCLHYDKGVKEAESFVETWKTMKPYVSEEIYTEQLKKFERQAKDAWWWRDGCLLYFQTFSKMPLPKKSPTPRHKLEDLMNYRLAMDMYTAANPDLLP